MLNRSIAIALICSLFTAQFSKLFIYAGFELNQNYIAKALCENRNRPELHCNGKCYLMKKLKLAEEKEQKQERQSQKNLVQEACFNEPATIKFRAILLATYSISLTTDIPTSYKGSVFHPPKNIC